jgi:predicted Zn-dependent protease with MMP-like domain
VTGSSSHLDKGWRSLDEGDFRGARQAAERDMQEDPGNPEALLLLAACARAEGNFEQSLDLLAQASAADEEWGAPSQWMAEILAEDLDRPEDALKFAKQALERADEEEEFLDAVVLKAGLEIQLGKTKAAQVTLSELPSADEVDLPPELSLDLGYLFLEAEVIAEAERRFRPLTFAKETLGGFPTLPAKVRAEQSSAAPHALTKEPPGGEPTLPATVRAEQSLAAPHALVSEHQAEAWYGLGLCAEALSDESGKRDAWLHVLTLDGEAPLAEPRLSEAEMGEVAEQALKELPESARKLIANVPIVIVDSPARQEVERGMDPRLLGMFEGTAYSDGGTLGGAPQVTQILLFRKNLERMAVDTEDLREQIRITLLHETGHFFGMSEADLADVGLD